MTNINLYPAIQLCEVCGSNRLSQVLNLGLHPLCDDLIPVGEKAKCLKYPIEIMYCSNCGTAHHKYQVKKSTLFPQSYHYRSRFTADVLSGMTAFVGTAEKLLNSLKGRLVLDIGCNDGSLLDIFSAKGATTIGVEPTNAYVDAQGRQHLIINDFFSESTALRILKIHPRIDIITFTNVFAHIEDLPALLKALLIVMNEDTTLIVENHYLGAVLERNQFDTFYHEHPRTYSLKSFLHIAQILNREVVAFEFPQRYGGNIRVVIGKKGTGTPEVISLTQITIEKEAAYLEKFTDMQKFIAFWKKEKKAMIQEMLKKHGKLQAKAFPGRAAILVTLLELSDKEIECVYEKPGSLKIGNYLPGTRIPIRSDDELIPHLPETKVLLNLAWHIPREIESYLRNKGYRGELIHIV
jgi:SAM-dependent methyltransferase